MYRRGYLSILIMLIMVFSIFAQTKVPATLFENRGLTIQAKTLGNDALIGTQWLVLIGINKYQDTHWPSLQNPVRDCRELKAILESGYLIDQTIELYDEQATAAGIYKLFENLQKNTQVNDSVLIYYAGHGNLSTITDLGYIIPVDGGASTGSGWISNGELRSMIRKIPSRHICLILDSCFSGDILDDRRSIRPTINDEYFKRSYSLQSRQVLTSGASETVPDASEFSAQLKIALKGNNRPIVDPLMLYNEIRTGVRSTMPLFGSLRDASHQDGGSFLLFAKNQEAPGTMGPRTAEGRPEGYNNTAPLGMKIDQQSLGQFKLEPGETAKALLGSRGSPYWTIAVQKTEGLLQKIERYYLYPQGDRSRRLGPFKSFRVQDNEHWVAYDTEGALWVGNLTSIAGPLGDRGISAGPKTLSDKQLAFITDTAISDTLHVGSSIFGPYTYIYRFMTSPDRTSYVALANNRETNQTYLLKDSQALGPYKRVFDATWSGDSKHFAYTVEKDNQVVVLLDHTEVGRYSSVLDIVFAPDNRTLAFLAKQGDKFFIHAGAESLGPFNGELSGLRFSPDGTSFAFTETTRAGSFVHLGGAQKYGPYAIWNLDYGFAGDRSAFYLSGMQYGSNPACYEIHVDGKVITSLSKSASIGVVQDKNLKHTALLADITWGQWTISTASASYTLNPVLGYGLQTNGLPVYWSGETGALKLWSGDTVVMECSQVQFIPDPVSFAWIVLRGQEISLIMIPR